MKEGRNLTKSEILEYLREPEERYWEGLAKEAKEVHRTFNGDRLTVTAMLGYDNICKNQCLYCGMRAANSKVPRYRMTPEEIREIFEAAAKTGLRRAFLISGEDPGFGTENLCRVASDLKKVGMTWVSLAAGEFEKSEFQELHAAGVDEFVLKFEMADEDTFNRLNPSTTYKKRMEGIRTIKELGYPLASGGIVGYPGQTLEMLADDILLMKELEISWAPVIPYMPAANTPLALEGGPGSVDWMLRTISLLRVMLPHVNITAGQPGKDLKEGLSGREGNLAALRAGGNFLYADLLPASKAENFRVVDNRILLGVEHAKRMAEESGMTLVF